MNRNFDFVLHLFLGKVFLNEKSKEYLSVITLSHFSKSIKLKSIRRRIKSIKVYFHYQNL